ncbi:Hypothetical predicted protein, partial [Paramuricea clavata]
MNIISGSAQAERLSTRSKPAVNIIENATGKDILISSELAILPNKLCFIWASTLDRKLRKFALPDKHRYGLKFHISRKCSHVVLLILLAGDIATNPGPTAGSRETDNSKTLWLKVLYLNARSLKAFVHPIGDKSVKVYLLKQFNHLNSEILPNYGSIFRCDRADRIGGGVLVAVKTGIQVTRRHDLEPDNTELVVTELMKSNNKPIILYTFYRPPDSKPDLLQQLNDSIQNNPESSRIVLVGDFILPSIKWSSDQKTPINIGGPAENEIFYDLVDDNFLLQYILGPTPTAGNKLDLLMCNSPEIVGDVSFKRAKPINRRVFDYGKGNFDELRNFLTRYPINVTPTDSINDDWEQWKDTFLTAVRRYIPMRTVKDKNSPPWIDKQVRQLIRKKFKALKQYRRNKSADRKRKLRSVTQQIKYLIRSKHRGYLAKIE